MFEEHPASLDQTVINDAERSTGYIELATFLITRGRLKGTSADDLYRKAFQIAPEVLPETIGDFNSFAWQLVTTPETHEWSPIAVELAKRAVKLAPTDRNCWNTLGVAQYRNASWNAAIESLEKSMELRHGGDAHDWFFVAMSHWRLDHKDEARQWYDKAVEWTDKNAPQNEELSRFRQEAAKLLGITEPHPSNESAAPNDQSPQNDNSTSPPTTDH